LLQLRPSHGLPGTKSEVQKPDRGTILHVQTALITLTVLEMTEAVSTVAWVVPCSKWSAREQSLYPTDEKMWRRICFVVEPRPALHYELDPAGSVPQMDFAIDQPVLIHQLPSFCESVGQAQWSVAGGSVNRS